jgi:hypothetical protein
MNPLYDEWFKFFGFQRDVRLQHHALYLTLIEKNIIDAETYKKHWQALMEKDLQHIRKNLERKTKNKRDKSNFHFGVFAFFKRLISG